MNLKEVDLIKVYRAWKKNLGVYRCFFRSTPFVSLKTYEDFKLLEYKSGIKREVVNKIVYEVDNEYFSIVDLDFNEIVDLGLILNNEFDIKAILNINLVFNDFALLGDNKMISELINCGMNLEDKKCSKYVMLIPYDRFKENTDESEMKNKLNNQYAIGFDDLPTEEFLKSLGYKGIKIITKSSIKEDLLEYIDYMKSKIGVKIVKVD